jgi:hypothetical protein
MLTSGTLGRSRDYLPVVRALPQIFTLRLCRPLRAREWLRERCADTKIELGLYIVSERMQNGGTLPVIEADDCSLDDSSIVKARYEISDGAQ